MLQLNFTDYLFLKNNAYIISTISESREKMNYNISFLNFKIVHGSNIPPLDDLQGHTENNKNSF